MQAVKHDIGSDYGHSFDYYHSRTVHKPTVYQAGDTVEKIGQDAMRGVVVGTVIKLNGQVRYVVEYTNSDVYGLIRIFSAKDLRRVN